MDISKTEGEAPTVSHHSNPHASSDVHHEGKQPAIVPIEEEALEDAEHIHLSWRSWLVVFITCFAIMAQVFVVVAAGSVIAFIIRELGEAPLAGWVIQVRLPMPSYTAATPSRDGDSNATCSRVLFSCRAYSPPSSAGYRMFSIENTSRQYPLSSPLLVRLSPRKPHR